MRPHLPSPTIWPVALALGVTLATLGAITSPLVIVAGVVLVVWALASWIGLLLAEGHE